MSLHDEFGGEKNVLCDGCQSMHVHLGEKDSRLADPRISTRLSGWVLDEEECDFCPECAATYRSWEEGDE